MAGRYTVRPEGSNWGEFGPDDQVGRMNYVTAARRLAGAREIQEGRAFCLSLPLDYPGGTEICHGMREPPRLSAVAAQGQPFYNFVLQGSPFMPGAEHRPAFDISSDDRVVLDTQYSTQWDALAHWGQVFDRHGNGQPEKVYYNGFSADEYVQRHPDGSTEARALGIEKLAETCVQGRAVLVNLVHAYGTARKIVGYDDLMHAMEQQQCSLEKGDFLLVYTGYADAILRMNRRPDMAVLNATGAVLNGWDAQLLKWIDRSGVAAICADNFAVEHVESGSKCCDFQSWVPLHELCLFKLGVHLGELWHLGPLAAWLLNAGRSACMLTAPPLRLPGAVGSPVTPVATV